ncbi:4'-phosphopantetheinyl transferase family protein [Paenibacillus alba]|uniref:4'-phosphopantetheinyl transferase superfamily protein n=1 Tax=Paenibacillus alba TaxID=1197127 RepID=A0ABU6G5M2_9BACL|nr:4'-phosphopantetheinyl transferase superfamily protein [Paenibacillus alba]MEC0228910.1 4'-phosphopantetheinyl transferase superfamily protein [Paenibacillus alba]
MIAITHLYILSIDDVSSISVEELLPLVSEEKRTKLRKFHRQEDLLRGLWADLLLRKLIIENLQLANSQITFEYGAYGKPRVCGNHPFHYNISHSGKWVACILDSQPVGVDVEHMQAFDESLVLTLFAQEEYRYIMEEADSRLRQLRFYQLWTAKESYMKAIGLGLSLPLHTFSVITPEGVEGAKRIQGEDWFLKSYPVDPAYSFTSCSKSLASWDSMEIAQPSQILEIVRSVSS